MKTIKQIADEIGVTKTAISKEIKKLGLHSSLQKSKNQFLIDNEQEKLIKQAFKNRTQTNIENQNENKSQMQTDKVCDLLIKQIEELQQQLKEKDNRIMELTNKLSENTDKLLILLSQQQQLHAQSNANNKLESSEQKEEREKKSFWKRLFKG